MFNLFVSLDCFGFQKIIRGVLLAVVLAISISLPLWAQWPDDTVYAKWTPDVYRLQLSNDDSNILTYGQGGTLIFETLTGTQLKQFNGTGQYTPDGKSIIFSTYMKDSSGKEFLAIDMYDAMTFEKNKTVPIPSIPRSTIPGILPINISNDMNTLVVRRINDKSLTLVDFNTGEIIHTITDSSMIHNNDFTYKDFFFTKDDQHLIANV